MFNLDGIKNIFSKKIEIPSLVEAPGKIVLPEEQKKILEGFKYYFEGGSLEIDGQNLSRLKEKWLQYIKENLPAVRNHEKQLAENNSQSLPDWYKPLSLWRQVIDPMNEVLEVYRDFRNAQEGANLPSLRSMEKTDADQLGYIARLERELRGLIARQKNGEELTKEIDLVRNRLKEIDTHPLQAARRASIDGGFQEVKTRAEEYAFLAETWFDGLSTADGTIPKATLEMIAAARIAQNLGGLLNYEAPPSSSSLTEKMDAGRWDFGLPIREESPSAGAIKQIDEAMVNLMAATLGSVAETDPRHQPKKTERKKKWEAGRRRILNMLPVKA